ncbi:MAG TPA: AMP-binding protein [Terriglobales bacterium]|jgi:long-chain acyl-CoA synthetase|nr:AMP-binding protein [Terriglobales bacterium]
MSTFYDRFVECAARWPANVALEIQQRNGVESYTYAQLRQMSESVGRWLTENGFPLGARIAILADNHPRWVAAYLGTIAAGCTAVPLDTSFHAEQITTLLKDSGSSVLFCDTKHIALAQAAVSGLPLKIILTDAHVGTAAPGPSVGPSLVRAHLDSMFAAGPGNFRPVSAPSDSVAALLYTSGTTADPKGVMLTHANLMGEVAAVFGRLQIGPEDSILGLLPLFHALAQMANLLLPLVTGARAVYLETLNTTELLRALRERRVTAFAVVPQFFYLIHERIFKEVAQRGRLARWGLRLLMSLNQLLRRFGINAGAVFFRPIHQTFGAGMRYLVTGGSRFEPQIWHDFHALGIDVLQAYGLTETSGGAFVNLPGDIVIGSVGLPLPGVEARVVDPQPQEEGPPVGEIAMRGDIVMKGYWNRPDATAAVLKDGWLYTGDLGYFDAHGNLFITGRAKEVIVLSNGKNIYPEEIEAHYLKSPYIREICVIGLDARPGDPTSERLHAVVVPNFEVLRQRKIVNATQVVRFDIEGLSVKLPSTKRVGSYEIWQDDLPRTTTRKLKRFEIEKRARANQARGQAAEPAVPVERALTGQEAAWLDQADVRRALKLIRNAARTAPPVIRPGDNLELDLGLDSMQRVELLVELEQEFGADVDEAHLAETYTVRDLVELVLQGRAHGKEVAVLRPQFAGWKTVLEEEPADPEVLALAQPQPVQEALLYALSRTAQLIAYDRFPLRVTGLDKVPARGPYIISSNHQSYLDPIILGSLLPWTVFRELFSVGTSEIFGSGFMRRLARWLRVIVVDPDANLIPAMRAGAFGLRHGRILILYPEGERSIDGTPKVFRKGAAILSIHLQVPIVPVAIEGFYDAWPRGKPFQKFAPLQIAFGDPINPPPQAQASETTYEQLAAELKARVVGMWNELRGERSKVETSAQAAD